MLHLQSVFRKGFQDGLKTNCLTNNKTYYNGGFKSSCRISRKPYS